MLSYQGRVEGVIKQRSALHPQSETCKEGGNVHEACNHRDRR